MATKFISDIAHYNEVLSKVAAVKRSLWIGTADIKDLHVKMGSATAPFLGLLAQLLKCGVEIRLIHAKEPGSAYIGSANRTGAGIGMKSGNRRNFEAGILSDAPDLVEAAMEQFDSVWRGAHCDTCGRKDFCIDPIR